MTLWLAAAAVAAILAAVLVAGFPVAAALVPQGREWYAERWGWSFPMGAALLATAAALALALGFARGWIPFLLVAGAAAAISFALRPRAPGAPAALDEPAAAARGARWLLRIALGVGVLLYVLRAMTEPMWSNDFLAIWGLKGKAMFLARAFPSRLWPPAAYGFSHPEYPLGLPLLYAGVAALLGRWDDHALALLFPAMQAATLVVLFGWLRRRGASWSVAMGATTLLAWFEPLYSGFLTGLAEVPLSAAFLLFGTAYSDSLDAEAGGARSCSRLAAASLLAGFLKNEGIFLACVGGAGAIGARRFRAASAALAPAAAAAAVSRLASGGAPLRDFDFGFLGARAGELPGRLGETVRAVLSEIGVWGGASIACLVLLFLAGRRAPFADRLLGLAAACLAAYVVLPAFAVRGPSWLVSTTLPRTVAALGPLIAAGIAGRFMPSPPLREGSAT